jgi:hypothetical protein
MKSSAISESMRPKIAAEPEQFAHFEASVCHCCPSRAASWLVAATRALTWLSRSRRALAARASSGRATAAAAGDVGWFGAGEAESVASRP